uniref:A kinase (PRKA) anchor protein 7 n=2 Tax=Cyprinus carpio TaxID=7962 RepID=A0A8C1D8G5_CYPCA
VFMDLCVFIDSSVCVCVCVGVKKAPAPDDEELVSLSKQLVEDAVLRAVQQYMEETQQNGNPFHRESQNRSTNQFSIDFSSQPNG